MFKIEVYFDYSLIIDNQSIIKLIQCQLVTKSEDHIKQALKNALRPENRAVLFIGYGLDDAPIAFAFGNSCSGLESGGNYYWLNELFVDQSFRRRGYGKKLLSFIEDWLISREINYIACVTGEINKAAQLLYEDNNYELSKIVWVDKKLS